jgi:uncharacterized protein YecE (DUF72 family)
MPSKYGRIYTGIGGWTYAPWRGEFYPKGLPHTQELRYAASHLTSIEINGTFYRTQSPASYRKWASEVPDGFVFSLKGPRFAVNRSVLAEAGDSIKRFLNSGVTELGDRLGPLLWQFAPTKKYDEADFGKFLEHLPDTFDGRTLRHVVEVRHDSFSVPAFVQLLRRFGIAVCFSEHATYPAIPDVTADFVYARLQKGKDTIKTGYPRKHSMPGRRASSNGPAAAHPKICPWSILRPSSSGSPATSLCISSTRERCGLPLRQ